MQHTYWSMVRQAETETDTEKATETGRRQRGFSNNAHAPFIAESIQVWGGGGAAPRPHGTAPGAGACASLIASPSAPIRPHRSRRRRSATARTQRRQRLNARRLQRRRQRRRAESSFPGAALALRPARIRATEQPRAQYADRPAPNRAEQ